MKEVLKRFSEPSSYNALMGLFGALGISTDGWWQGASFVAAGVAMLAGFFMREKGEPK